MNFLFQIGLILWPLIVIAISLTFWFQKEQREKNKINYPSLLWWSYSLVSWFPMVLLFFLLPQIKELFYYTILASSLFGAIIVFSEMVLHFKGRLNHLRLRAYLRVLSSLSIILLLRYALSQGYELSASHLFISFYLLATACSQALDAYFLHSTHNHINFESGYNSYQWYSPLVTHRYGFEKLKLIGSYFLIFHLFTQLFFALI